MLQIPCPHCGLRSEHEFICTGEAGVRPAKPDALDDSAWADHLYHRDNPDAPVLEHWWHVYGCRAWLSVRRDPHTQVIVSASAGRPPP